MINHLAEHDCTTVDLLMSQPLHSDAARGSIVGRCACVDSVVPLSSKPRLKYMQQVALASLMSTAAWTSAAMEHISHAGSPVCVCLVALVTDMEGPLPAHATDLPKVAAGSSVLLLCGVCFERSFMYSNFTKAASACAGSLSTVDDAVWRGCYAQQHSMGSLAD